MRPMSAASEACRGPIMEFAEGEAGENHRHERADHDVQEHRRDDRIVEELDDRAEQDEVQGGPTSVKKQERIFGPTPCDEDTRRRVVGVLAGQGKEG